MSSQARRRVAAILILATFASVVPSHAGAVRRRSLASPRWSEPARTIFSYLLYLFDFSNGTMDPNG